MTRFVGLFVLLVAPVMAQESPGDAHFVIFMAENGVIPIRFDIRIGGKTPRATFDTYIDNLMASLDQDKDGRVTVEEARGKVLTAREAQQAQLVPPGGNPIDSSPDMSPADGIITRQELVSHFKRMQLNPFALRFRSNNVAPARNRQPQQAVNSTNVPLFARLDTNADGRLSSDELTSALRTLSKLDLDDDETISAAELNPISNNQFAVPQQQMNSPRVPVNNPFLGLGSDETIQKEIKRLIDKYDSVDPLKSEVAGSKVRNQRLSPRELGISGDAFNRFDGDGDGQLDSDELRQFLASPDPVITIEVDFDAAVPVVATSNRDEFQEKLRATADGGANVNLGTTQFSISRTPAMNLGTAGALLKPQFMAADVDANGYLEKSEADRAFLFGATFENLDADKNGKIFLDEIVTYFQVRFDAARARTVLSIDEQGRTLFEILDTDRDRRLSFRELQMAAGKVSLWDKDGDGLLAESEIPLQYRLVIARGNLPSLETDFVLLDPGLLARGVADERTSGPIWFRKMDKNRDGEVSQREFLGELAIFDMLDRNQDGFLDLTEAVTASGPP